MTGRSGGRGLRWFAVLGATVLTAVPTAAGVGPGAAGAAGVTSGAGGIVTDFPVSTYPRDITAGPDGALWFTNSSSSAGNGSIGRITTAGVVTTYTDPTILSPGDITTGPDGALWFTDDRTDSSSIGRIDPSTHAVTSYTDPTLASSDDITSGPDGALWFTNGGTFADGVPTADKGSIGRIDPTTHVITNYRDASIVYPGRITAGSDGALWFTNTAGSGAGDKGSIGRITTNGIVTSYTDPSIISPGPITSGPDGNVWFTNLGAPRGPFSIGRITTAGVVTNYTSPSIFQPFGIAAGPDGALWFTNFGNAIGRITTGGSVTNYRSGSPSSQSDSPFAITAGPDGALWFTTFGDPAGGSIGRITTSLTASAPGSPSAAPGRGGATVHWTAPVAKGGAPITAYVVTPYLGGAAQAPQVFRSTATSETLTGLTNGKTYQFKIAAENANGIGGWSAFTYPVAIGPPSPWKIVPSPTPRKGSLGGGTLASVSCTGATNCFAVGLGDSTGQNEPLIERWNGTSWLIVAAPAPANGGEAVLSGVSCTDATHCIAVGGGDAGPLAEQWNGTRWSITPIAGPTELFGVSCTSRTQCFAVGIIVGTPVIERWNGTKWTTVSSPTASGYLTGVSCASAKDCVAVGLGLSSPALLEHWNGKKWTIVATPHSPNFVGGSFAGVSCAAVTSCFAVGQGLNNAEQSQTFVAEWNGTKWSAVASPNPDGFFGGVLNGVSCASRTACTAVGINESGSTNGRKTFSGTLIEQWNGHTWSVVGSPNPKGLGTLNGVACITATKCYAVGYSNSVKTLIERT